MTLKGHGRIYTVEEPVIVPASGDGGVVGTVTVDGSVDFCWK